MPTIDRDVARFFDDAGIRVRRVFKYTGPNPYVNTGTNATSGDLIVPGNLSMGVIEVFLPGGGAYDGVNAIRFLTVDYTSAGIRVHWFVGTTGVEVANGVDLSSFSVRVEAVGR